MRHKGFLLGVVLVLVSDGVALIGVVRNRSGGAAQTIEVTERELELVPGAPDDSSVRLRLRWRFRPGPETSSNGFGEAELREVGFACPSPQGATIRNTNPPAREAFVVLEFDPEYKESPSHSPGEPAKSESRMGTDEATRPGSDLARPAPSSPLPSRLFLVDASESYERLRARYPEPGRYLILRGVVRAYLPSGEDAAKNKPAAGHWRGRVTLFLPPEINVPLPFSRKLAPLKRHPQGRARYRVGLTFGQRLEPWVSGVEVLQD